ncbi:MAG: glycosyltransferase family 4 protein [Chloroflexi bacterium]|nr:glycosyltransferase family 4 protein [Chloroflexota bacterium]
MRIAVFSERLAPPFDEGIKNYVLHLIRELRRRHRLLALTAFGRDVPEEGIRNLPSNPLLLSPWVATALRRFRPELILYVPTACATLFSFWRSRLLKRYGRGAPVVMIALQTRRYGLVARALMPWLRPECVLAQSQATGGPLAAMGCRVFILPPAVDVERFRPAEPDRRVALRRRYGLDPNVYLGLHVGHLNRGRNIQALAELQGREGMQILVVGSSSTPDDHELVAELEQAGVRVISGYVPHIEELYALADCYLFPVCAENRAIDVPLSVLEAMACDLPVVTTRYGGLEAYFAETEGFRYVDDTSRLAAAVRAIRYVARPGTRQQILPYTWPQVVEGMIALLERELGLAGQMGDLPEGMIRGDL